MMACHIPVGTFVGYVSASGQPPIGIEVTGTADDYTQVCVHISEDRFFVCNYGNLQTKNLSSSPPKVMLLDIDLHEDFINVKSITVTLIL